MAERASVFQTVQFGIEVTPGSAVAANRKFASVSITPGIEVDIKKYRKMGSKWNRLSIIGKEWVTAEISGPLTYTEWPYLAANCLAYAAPVQQGATAAYKWTNNPADDQADVTKTFTIEQGGTVRAHSFPYAQLDSLGYSINRTSGEATIKGSLIGQRLSDGITMTASPTELALEPVLPDDICIYADDSAAALGTTKLTRALKADWMIDNRFGPIFPIDCALTSFAATVEQEDMEAKFDLLMAADTQGMGLLTTMRAGSKKFIRVVGTGSLIATPYTYVWQHDMCLTVSGVKKFEDDEGIYAIGWEFTVTYDATWGKAMQFDTTNAITTL